MLSRIWAVVRRVLRILTLTVFSVTVLPASMVAVGLVIVLFAPVPVTIPDRKVQPAMRPTVIFDLDGNPLAVFKRVDTNIPVRKGDIPAVLRHAVVAAEDRRFYSHHGVDAKGLVRALRRDLQRGEAEQGASTITQQLVKNVYYPDDTGNAALQSNATRIVGRAWRKLRIAVIANRLDREMAKSDILHEYLSNIFLGNGAYGVGAAAQTYFRKSIRDLTASEAATIAGIIPAPSKYEPRGNLRNAEFKRRATLRQMLDVGYLTPSEYADALDQVLWLYDERTPPPPGKHVTLVYPPTSVRTQEPYFVDYVRRYLVARYGEEKVYGGGLTVRATLDPKLQRDAQRTAQDVLRGTSANLELSIVSVEPLTGFVKALVGGRDFYAPDGQVNLALGYCPTPESIVRLIKHAPKIAPPCEKSDDVSGGGSGRSPGSSIKPVVLAAAFAKGIPPSQVIDASPYKDPRCAKPVKGCVINNYEGASYGPVDLRTATVRSVNTAYARLGYQYVGIDNVARMAQKLGITSAWYDPARHGPSYALGGIDVSPLEMASAYSVFAGRGRRAAPTPVLSVVDAQGNVLEDNAVREPTQVISTEVADNVTDVLREVVTSGTGTAASLGDRPVAGKTGTSQGYGNAWFVGYTPTLSTSVWMGYKDRPRPLLNIRGVGRVAGGTIPARTWSTYMRRAMEGVPPTAFDAPAPIKRPRRVDPAAELARRARGGFDAGTRRSPAPTPSVQLVTRLPFPTVDAPLTPRNGLPVITLPPSPTIPAVIVEQPGSAAPETTLQPDPVLPGQ